MSPNGQRIAIAQVCGWTEISSCTCSDNISRGFDPNKGAHKKHLPDYLSDLNAMREAEMEWIDATNEAVYRGFLVIACGEWRYHRATAVQRAKAFLRTLNLWDDSK